jgi:hypothetical protein
MEPFRDPVVTPAGFTYERSALFQHFAKLGAFDPVSRQRLRPEQCVSNIAVRAATQVGAPCHVLPVVGPLHRSIGHRGPTSGERKHVS